jgi:hypothetical protein
MICEECGAHVQVVPIGAGEKCCEPVDKNMLADKDDIKVPFYCKTCGSIKFEYKAVRDVVFLYPKPLPEKIGSIHLPSEHFVGGSPQEKMAENSGIVLSVGPGGVDTRKKVYYSTKGLFCAGDKVWYNRKVPWRTRMKGTDGKEHEVVYCGVKDVWAKRD